MLEARWMVAGAIVGMLISTVLVPPNRKVKVLPSPADTSAFHVDSGCVRFISEEVPCTSDPTSLNLLASR
jgi:hypothetical protein